MKGFSLKKEHDNGPQKKFGGFKLNSRKQAQNTVKKISVLGEDPNISNSKIGQKVAIDSIDQIHSNYEEKKEELVIKPIVNGNNWEARRKRVLQNQNSSENIIDNDRKMSFGLNVANKKSQNIITEEYATKESEYITPIQEVVISGPETTKESYEKVPVGQFGAAMLRGMGWKGEDDKKINEKTAPDDVVKPRLPFLGLGAKPSTEQEESSSSYRASTREYTPVIKREISRDRSPRRSA